MLILARQLNERIILPTVPAAIEIVAIKPNGVRLGIDAPAQVTVLREEVLRRGGVKPCELLARTEEDAQTRLNRIKHVLRNRLASVALGLDLIDEQIGDTDASELQALLQRMKDEVRRLDRQLHALLSASAEPDSSSPRCATALPDVSPCAVVEADGEFAM